jgi:hypothetical protein
MQFLAHAMNLLPAAARIRAIDMVSASMGYPPSEFAKIDPPESASWVTSGYVKDKYPGCILGAPGLAVSFLSGLTGFPFLPQPLLYNARFDIKPDDSRACLDAGRKLAEPLLAKYRDVEAIIHFDPVHDRFLISRVVFIRLKYLSIPKAYFDFIRERVDPNGTIILIDCKYPWPIAEVSDRLFFQLGGLGDIPARDYLNETPELVRYREQWGATNNASWKIDAEFVDRPESEWGSTGAFLDDAESLSKSSGLNVVRFRHSHPIELSKAVFNLYEKCRNPEIKSADVYIATFTHTDPRLPLVTGAIPLWLPFITRDNLRFAEEILVDWDKRTKLPSDKRRLFMTLHPSFCSPPDLLTLDEWQRLRKYLNDFRLLGINPSKYPSDIASYVSMYPAVVRAGVNERLVNGEAYRRPSTAEVMECMDPGVG